MPLQDTQLVDSLSFEGALRWPMAIWLFVGLAFLISWLLWRERIVTGARTALFFLLLRLSAVAIVLWMLLGPTHLCTERTTIPQTLVIVVDGSQSMEVTEPMPDLERLRWQQAASVDSNAYPELREIDSALVSLRYALSKTTHAISAAKEFASAEEVIDLLGIVKNSTVRGSEHLAFVGRSLAKSNPEQSQAARDTSEALARRGAPSIDRMIGLWEEGSPTEIPEDLDALVEDFERWIRRSEALERTVASRAKEVDNRNPDSVQGDSSRKTLAAQAIRQLQSGVLKPLAEKANIRLVHVDESVTPIAAGHVWSDDSITEESEGAASDGGSPASMGPVTNLSSALQMIAERAAAESIAGAVLISDGGHNAPDTPDPRTVATGLAGVPVHVVPVGSQSAPRDLQIYRVNAPRTVIVYDQILFDVLVTGHFLNGERVMIELRKDGQSIEKQSLAFDSDHQDHRIRFRAAADKAGRQEYEVLAHPVIDETITSNNSAIVAVNALRDKLRVLLADRMTRWEYRYLDHLFRRDSHVQCDKLLFAPTLLATGLLESRRELPRDVEGWSKYDVVILGDLAPAQFDSEQQQSLAEWVRQRGGKLIVVAGHDFMPHNYAQGALLEMLPVQAISQTTPHRNGFLPSLTPQGNRHEAMMLSLSHASNGELWRDQFRAVPIYYLSSYCRPKPAAHVLIEAVPADDQVNLQGEIDRVPERSLLAWQAVGAGRIVYLASPVTYHLRFRRGDELHHRFWGQLLRWLTAAQIGERENRVLLRIPNSRYQVGEPIEVTATLTDKNGVPVTLPELSAEASPLTGDTITVPLSRDESVPGRYYGRFERLPRGAYRISTASDAAGASNTKSSVNDDATAFVTVFMPDNLEMSNTRADRALLREIAEVTGGQVLPPTAIGEILELSAHSPRVIEDSVRTPLWNRWRYLWIVAGCLIGEWSIRRRIGVL